MLKFVVLLAAVAVVRCDIVPMVAVRAHEALPESELENTEINSKAAAGDPEKQEVCCEDLGCFSAGGPFFHPLYRPLTVPPSCALRNHINLLLNTRENRDKPDIMDPYNVTSIVSSHFRVKRSTRILIHGYLDNVGAPDWTRAVDALLKNEDCNVIRVDWSYGNAPPYYRATANTRLVGAYIAKFIVVLQQKYGLDPASMHLIGHSLGAHIAGYAGKFFKSQNGTKIGRITGLDPAGPNFSYMPEETRLNATDAKVVDTIVTDGEDIINNEMVPAYGSPQSMGHLNFFPNGGKNQPGCKSRFLRFPEKPVMPRISIVPESMDIGQARAAQAAPKFVETIRDTVSEVFICNHHRAVQLFIESVDNRMNAVKGYQCESYNKYLQGDCLKCTGGMCSPMGLHADLSLAEDGKVKNFFTATMAQSPFTTHATKVTFKLMGKDSGTKVDTISGFVFVTLKGKKGSSSKIQLNSKAIDLVPGKTYSSFFEIPEDIGEVQSVDFSWTSERGINFLGFKYIYVDGDIQLVRSDELIKTFKLARTKVQEKLEVPAVLRIN